MDVTDAPAPQRTPGVTYTLIMLAWAAICGGQCLLFVPAFLASGGHLAQYGWNGQSFAMVFAVFAAPIALLFLGTSAYYRRWGTTIAMYIPAAIETWLAWRVLAHS